MMWSLLLRECLNERWSRNLTNDREIIIAALVDKLDAAIKAEFGRGACVRVPVNPAELDPVDCPWVYAYIERESIGEQARIRTLDVLLYIYTTRDGDTIADTVMNSAIMTLRHSLFGTSPVMLDTVDTVIESNGDTLTSAGVGWVESAMPIKITYAEAI